MTQHARMLEKSREYQIGTYIRKFVAPEFQRLIRLEAATQEPRREPAMVDCQLSSVWREVGECVCVTCGRVAAWKGNQIGGGEMDTGHFLAGRRASILFEEGNVAPQCKFCNRTGGEQQLFRKWMVEVRGLDAVERLERLKNETKQFTREELVELRIGYKARLKAAEKKLAVSC